MAKTLGVCGYVSSGSSAVIDLLKEFDNMQALDQIEFLFPYFPDGLEDLECKVTNCRKYFSSTVAINRFRQLMKWNYLNKPTNEKTFQISEEFLKKIIQVSWRGRSMVDELIVSRGKAFIIKITKKMTRGLRLKKHPKFIEGLMLYNIETAISSDDFDAQAKDFISNILSEMGRDQNKITVLDQPFEGCDPVKSFKYFDDPKAVVVNRDPRDQYLFNKIFLRKRGIYHTPCDNVDDYIKYYKLIRKSPPDLRERNDVLYMNFEELVYDYDNAVSKVAHFCGAGEHTNKGKFFKPTHSASNTQLFRKFTGYEEDIAKIEAELPEYLFDFDKYPEVQPEGGMFWGSQGRKRK